MGGPGLPHISQRGPKDSDAGLADVGARLAAAEAGSHHSVGATDGGGGGGAAASSPKPLEAESPSHHASPKVSMDNGSSHHLESKPSTASSEAGSSQGSFSPHYGERPGHAGWRRPAGRACLGFVPLRGWIASAGVCRAVGRCRQRCSVAPAFCDTHNTFQLPLCLASLPAPTHRCKR